jgi:hypothetical protein
VRLIALLVLVALAGCTTAEVELADGTHVRFTRFATDAAMQLNQQGLTYSSSPSEVAQQNALDLVGQVLGVALRGGLVAGQPQALPQAYAPLPERLSLRDDWSTAGAPL